MSDEIYTMVPERPVVPEEIRNKILLLLKGMPNVFFNVDQIRESIGLVDHDKTQRIIRIACKELLHFNKEPIASSNEGFCYANDQLILSNFLDNMKTRVAGMNRTIADIEIVMSLPGVKKKNDHVVTDRSPVITSNCTMSRDGRHVFALHKEGSKICIHCKGIIKQGGINNG